MKIVIAAAGIAAGFALGIRFARWLITASPVDPEPWTVERWDQQAARYREQNEALRAVRAEFEAIREEESWRKGMA